MESMAGSRACSWAGSRLRSSAADCSHDCDRCSTRCTLSNSSPTGAALAPFAGSSEASSGATSSRGMVFHSSDVLVRLGLNECQMTGASSAEELTELAERLACGKAAGFWAGAALLPSAAVSVSIPWCSSGLTNASARREPTSMSVDIDSPALPNSEVRLVASTLAAVPSPVSAQRTGRSGQIKVVHWL